MRRKRQRDSRFYFECDEGGNLKLKRLDKLPVEVQRNITQLEVTTDKINAMVVQQKVKLKVVDRKGVYDSMARAANMFGEREQDKGNLAELIAEAAERVRRMGGSSTLH